MRTAAAIGSATTWRAAVLDAAALLVDIGAASPDYGPRCVATAEESGPYFVLTSSVALAHAQAGNACLAPGLSLLRLDEPVEFGHPTNDPVDLVFCLAAPGDDHVDAVGAFAEALAAGLASRLREAKPEDLDRLLKEAVGG